MTLVVCVRGLLGSVALEASTPLLGSSLLLALSSLDPCFYSTVVYLIRLRAWCQSEQTRHKLVTFPPSHPMSVEPPSPFQVTKA